MVDSAWPPKSPRDALLSSPGGRQKYQDIQRRRELLSSPLKRSNTTPNFRSKANQILDEGEDEDGGEDEETLELQLAEIQARLRLKQLQKKRARSGTASSNVGDGEDEHIRPASGIASSSRSQNHALVPRSPQSVQRRTPVDEVQVPVSPTKREAPPDPWSPQRYRMGIDKGWKANDVSLKRPPSSRPDARPASQLGTRSGAISRSSDVFSSRPQTSPAGGGLHRIKSFSERMAEGRAAEKARLERAERVQANRSSAFHLDKAEVDAFKTAAANRIPSPPSSSIREPEAPSYSREDIMRALNKPRPDGLTRSETAPNVRRNGKPSEEAGDSSKFESYSRQHLSSRVLPHSFLSRTLAEKKVLCIPDLLKTVKAPDFELPDEIDGDFVVFGIVASKSDPKQKQNAGNASAKTVDPYDDGLNNTDRYMVITLTDLKWSIDLFLFDTAFPRYYKVSEGTLIAILNPTIMPPPKHKLDTNRFSLALSSSDDKVLEIGHSRDIGYCKATRKDGKTCQTWVDGRKTEFCDFHVDLQIRRTQGQRMGVNSDTGMFGPGGKSGSRTGFFGEGGKRRSVRVQRDPNAPKQGLKSEGARYDWGSQSTYYVAPSRKNHGNRSSYHPNASGESAANLLDSVSDDPFIAAGMMGRGMENKEERLRRRLATQQREREITEKLVAGRTGVGADYLRSRTANESPAADGNKDKPSGTPSTPKTLPQSSSMNLASFGKAKNVRLSPMKRANANPHGSGVKKTRFITANGIREAGRESLGGPAETGTSRRQVLSDDDDDDELDII